MFSITFKVEPERIITHWGVAHPNTPVPSDLVSQAETFAKEVESEWFKYCDVFIPKLAATSGLTVSESFTVFILPPVLDEAQYLNEHEIEWGHSALFPGFIARGICHEILHCLTHDFYKSLNDDEKWVFHALIYLAVDEEFYRSYYNKIEYFTAPIVDSFYHPKLIKTARAILPQWIEFINNKGERTIYDLFKLVSMSNISKPHENN